MDVGDPAVADAEVDLAVVRIGVPGGVLRKSHGSRERQNAGYQSSTLHERNSFRYLFR